MLVTPSNGPRIRLRALLIDAEIRPTGPIDFDPCADCNVYCRKVCPKEAMDDKASIFQSIEFSESLPGSDGAYGRDLCNVRMEKDVVESAKNVHAKHPVVKYYRRCELVCPAGKTEKKNVT
jgi:epoxyqueuosine reductase